MRPHPHLRNSTFTIYRRRKDDAKRGPTGRRFERIALPGTVNLVHLYWVGPIFVVRVQTGTTNSR